MKWIINYFRGHEQTIRIGSRITTKFGTGVITGGNIMVIYDDSVDLTKIRNSRGRVKRRNNQSWTHNLDKLFED